MTDIQLRPCPFCGSEKLEHQRFTFVWCRECEAEGPNVDSEPEAIAAWNRRVEEKKMESTISEIQAKQSEAMRTAFESWAENRPHWSEKFFEAYCAGVLDGREFEREKKNPELTRLAVLKVAMGTFLRLNDKPADDCFDYGECFVKEAISRGYTAEEILGVGK